MTGSSSPVRVYEQEDDISSGWYLHRLGHGKKMIIPLTPVTYLGRSTCNSERVSLKHVSICIAGDASWLIRDLKSDHGTYVNDMPVPDGGLTLEEWDVISLGRKRPRNNDEFGFMLKFKELPKYTTYSGQSSVGSSDAKDSSRSGSPVHSNSPHHSPPTHNSSDENTQDCDIRTKSRISSSVVGAEESLNVGETSRQIQDSNAANRHSSKSGGYSSTSIIDISEEMSEDDDKDSEKTVRNPALHERPLHSIHLGQQKSITVNEKLDAWFKHQEPTFSPTVITSRKHSSARHDDNDDDDDDDNDADDVNDADYHEDDDVDDDKDVDSDDDEDDDKDVDSDEVSSPPKKRSHRHSKSSKEETADRRRRTVPMNYALFEDSDSSSSKKKNRLKKKNRTSSNESLYDQQSESDPCSDSDKSTPTKKQYKTRGKYHGGQNWVEDDLPSDSTTRSSKQESSVESDNHRTSDEPGVSSELRVHVNLKRRQRRTFFAGKQPNVGYYRDNDWRPIKQTKPTPKKSKRHFH